MTTLLILAAVTVAVTVLVLALLWVLDVRRITHPRYKQRNHDITPAAPFEDRP